MPTTEIAVFPLDVGTDINDSSNETYKELQKSFDAVVQQPDLQQYYLGTQTEAPQNLEVIIVGDSLSAHESWKTNPEDRLNTLSKKLLSESNEIYHVDFQPHSEFIAALQAPSTEFARFFFAGEPPSDYMSIYLKEIGPKQKAKSPGLLSIAAGITHEEVEYKGVKGKAAVLVLGWESLEAHTVDFVGSEVYKETIPTVKSTSKANEIHHVTFTKKGGDV